MAGPIPRSVKMIRCIILLVAGTAFAAGAFGQSRGKASHTVTVNRTAETLVSGPVRVPIDARLRLAEPARLNVVSNVHLLKIVFSLVEPDAQEASPRESEVDPSIADVRQLFSAEKRIHPNRVKEIDYTEIVDEIPGEVPITRGYERRRLVVTITE